MNLRRSPLGPFLIAVFTLAIASTAILSCQPAGEEATDAEPAGEAATEPEAGTSPPVIEMRTTDHAFHAPGKLSSGWTTFRMTNDGEEPHFFTLWYLPEGKTFEDYTEEVVPPFVDLLGKYRAGEMSRSELNEALGKELPGWYLTALEGMGRGGVGLTAPGRTSQTTLDLEPGEYVMECYVMSPEGKVHGLLGMLRPLVVTEESTGATPPEADVELTLSNYAIGLEGELDPGKQTVRVRVTETPEGLLGHDVHLAKLEEDTDLDEVARWMDFVDELQSPAPVEFVGGAEQVPAGHESYFTVDLEPGRYAWISEGYAQQGMVKEFTVE